MKKRILSTTLLTLVVLFAVPLSVWGDEWSYDFYGYCKTDGSGNISEGNGNAQISPTLGESEAFKANGTSFFNITTPAVNTSFGVASNKFKLSNYYSDQSTARIGLMASENNARIGFQNLTTDYAIVLIANAAPTVEGTNISLRQTIEGSQTGVKYGSNSNRTISNWNTYIYTLSSDGSASLKFASGNTIYSVAVTSLYTITYDGNGNSSGTVPTDSNSPYVSGNTVTVLDDTGSLAKTNYTFSGWNTAADGSGISYAAGETFDISANTILYAQWALSSLVSTTVGTHTFTTGASSAWTATTKNIALYSPSTNSQFMALSRGDAMAVNANYGLQLGNSSNGGAFVFYLSSASDITVNVKSNTASTVKLDYLGETFNVLTTDNYNTEGTNYATAELSNNTGVLSKTNAQSGYYKVYSTALIGITSLTISSPTVTHLVSAVTSTGADSYGTVAAEEVTVAENGTTTITATPATGYQVTNWSISGTGASIDPSGASNSNTTTLTMGTADATVTVTFEAKTYTVTLNNQEATTSGSANATATYNAILSNITCPEKAGYTFGGYFTVENGEGMQLIGSDGTWIAGVAEYTDASTNWIHDGEVTLYAKWTANAAPTYGVTISDGLANGSIVSDKQTAAENETVTLTVTPTAGYVLENVSVEGVTLQSVVENYKYSFTMPANAVNVSATFAAVNPVQTWDFQAWASGSDYITDNAGLYNLERFSNGVLTGRIQTATEGVYYTNKLPLNGVFGASNNLLKVRKNSTMASNGLIVESNNSTSLVIYKLKQGNWMRFNLKNEGSGTITFEENSDNVKVRKLGSSEVVTNVESDAIYVVQQDCNLGIAFAGNGNKYVYSIEISNTENVSAPVIGTYNNGEVTITNGTTTSSTSTVTTYYTLDGSTPSASHNDGSFTEVSKAIQIDQTRIVKTITISSTDVSSDVVTKKITVDAATPATTWNFANMTSLSYSDDATTIYYNGGNGSNFNYIVGSDIHSKMTWQNGGGSLAGDTEKYLTGTSPFSINDLAVGDKVYITYTGGQLKVFRGAHGNSLKIGETTITTSGDYNFDSGAEIEVTDVDADYNYIALRQATATAKITKIEINPVYTLTNATDNESGITIAITKENDAATDKTFESTFARGNTVTLQATYTATGKKLVWMDGEDNVLTANADGTLTITMNENKTIKATLAIPVWTVNDVTVESYTESTAVDGVQIHGNNTSGHAVSVKTLSPAKTGSFSNTDATEYSVSKYLEIPGAVSASTDEIANKAATMRLAANNTESLKEYLAMDVTEAGTLYVLYRPNSPTEGRNVYVGFQKNSDNSYTKTIQSATLGTEYTEIKHSGNGAGTFFVYGSIAMKVYAMLFVPETVKTLTTVASPADGGVIKVTNGNATYEGAANGLAVEPNAVLTLEATANTGYNFSAWSENVTSGSVTMDEDKTVTATFEAITYPLTITQPETGGSITATVDETSYSESTNVLENKTVTLSAAPADGYQLVGWTDGTNALGDLPKSLVNTITMTEAKTATATFETIPTVAGVTEESVWTFDGFGENTILSDKTVYGYNNGKGTLYISGHSTSGSITAAAKVVAGNMTGGQVVGTGEAVQPEKCLQLQGGGISSLAVSRTANSFTPDAIAFQAGVPGTVYVLMSGGYKTGETRSINIAANKSETDNTKKAIYSTTLTEGDPVQVVSCEIAEASSVFIGTSGGGKNIYAVKFVPAPTYAVTIPAVEHGSAGADKTNAAAGETVTLTVTPATGYMVDKVTVKNGEANIDVTTVTENQTYSFVMPAAAPTITISFKEIPTVYGTYDFRSFAKANLEVDGTASIEKTEGNVMTGSFTGITNTMTLKDAFGISYNAADKEIKLVRGADETTTGVAIPRGSAGQVGFYMYGLKAGDWFKIETGEVPLYIYKVNDGATIYFYDIDDTSKTNVTRNSEIVPGHTYVASQDITSMELNYNTSNTGNIYIYSAQLSNGDAVPSPTIGSYDFTTGKVEITANNSLKGNVPTAIYYTTDGTDPTNVMDNDHKYTGAIALTEATTIKAVAVLGEIKSTVAEKLVELETVNVPEVGELTDGKVTITAGTSTNPAVTTNTTYYTLDGSEPSAENNDGSFTEASKAIEIDQTRWLKTVTVSSTGVSSDVKAQKVVVDTATPSTVIDFVKDVTELKYGKENLLMYYYYNDGDTNEAKYNKSNAKFNYIVNPEVHTRLAVLSSDQNAVSSTADGLKVLNNGRPIAINDLHAGDKVYVTYTSTGNMKTAIYPERGDVVTIGEADVESKDTEIESGKEVVVKTVSTDYNYLMLMPVKDMIITKIEINPSFTVTNMTASDSGVTGVKVIKVDDATVDETFASEETKSFIRGSKVTLQAIYTAETGKSLLWLDAEDNELEANADGTLTLTVDADLTVKALYVTGITVTEVKNAENKMVARKLNNGLLEVTFDNNGRITAIKDVKSGKEVMASDDNNQRGYFNFNYRPSKDASVIDFGLECNSSGDIVQIGKSGSQQVELIYPTADAATPSHQTWKIGYVMKAGVSGIYTYAIMDGSSSYSELHEARFGWRVNPDIFNYAWVSDTQKGTMPTPAQMKNPTETVQDATFKLSDGTIYTKYDWANYVKDDQLHGIMGDGIGAWLISPSTEWVNGGPTKQELTVHATDTTPIILQTLHSSHFGAGEAVLTSSEDQKLFGPALFYVNSGTSQDAMVADAKQMVETEVAAWPYSWFTNNADIKSGVVSVASERGTVSGKVNVDERFGTQKVQVVLTQGSEKPLKDNNGYQYYTETEVGKNFEMKNVRPGTYKLYVYALDGGATGTYTKDNVEIATGANNLGEIEWATDGVKEILWRIGDADHTTKGFKLSDEKRHYGVWESVPETLTYTVGTSKESDWYYAQVKNDGTWNVKFNLAEAADAPLRLTIATAGASQTPKLEVKMNDNLLSGITFTNDAGIYRSSVTGGRDSLIVLEVPTTYLQQGENTLSLKVWNLGTKIGGVMYDCIKLESLEAEQKFWDFSEWTDVTSSAKKNLTVVTESNGLYYRAGAMTAEGKDARNINIVKYTSADLTWNFPDGWSYTAVKNTSNYAYLPGNSALAPAADLTPATKVGKELTNSDDSNNRTLAFTTYGAGTVYVAYRGTAEKDYSLYFKSAKDENYNIVAKSQVDASDNTKGILYFTAAEGGNFLIGGAAGMNVYAVKFEPAETVYTLTAEVKPVSSGTIQQNIVYTVGTEEKTYTTTKFATAFLPNTKLILTAEAKGENTFMGWDNTTETGAKTITMTKDLTVVANFDKVTFSAIYLPEEMYQEQGEFTFNTTSPVTVWAAERTQAGTWEGKKYTDFQYLTNMDTNKVSVRVGAQSITYGEDNSIRLSRPMAFHNLDVDDEITILYAGAGSLASVTTTQGDAFTIDGTKAEAGTTIPSGALLKVTEVSDDDNYVVVGPASSSPIFIKGIYINKKAPEFLHTPTVELKAVEDDTVAVYTISYDEGATLHYQLSTEEQEQEAGTTGAYDLKIVKSAKITAWTTKGDLKSENLEANVFAPTPAPSVDGNFDFAEASEDLPADMEVTLDTKNTVVVEGETFYKPTILTAATFEDKFAFSETTASDKIKIRTNRQLVFARGTDMDMVLLNLKKGDVIAFDYSGGTMEFSASDIITTDQSSLNGSRRAVAANETVVSGENYVVTEDGNLILHLKLTTAAVSIAKMVLTKVAEPSVPKVLDFATTQEEGETLEEGKPVTIYYNGQDTSTRFFRMTNDSESLPAEGKISTPSGKAGLTTGGMKIDRNRFAIHDLAIGDTIKIRFSGGELTFDGHATKGDKINVKSTGVAIEPGTTLESGVTIIVDKVDYLNNYLVFLLDKTCVISGIFINNKEVEKIIAPSIRDRENGKLVQITPGRSTMDREVFTCYTTDGTDPSMVNGISGLMSEVFDVELLELYDRDVTVKAVSYSRDGSISKIVEVVVQVVGVLTDISGVPTIDGKEVTIYDMNGRKVQTMTKGNIYIINGKKYLYK